MLTSPLNNEPARFAAHATVPNCSRKRTSYRVAGRFRFRLAEAARVHALAALGLRRLRLALRGPAPRPGRLSGLYKEAEFDSREEAHHAARTYGRFLPRILSGSMTETAQ